MRPCLPLLLLTLLSCGQSPTASTAPASTPPGRTDSRTQERILSNGLRLAVVHFAGSTNAALFTFVPLGLLEDGPGQTQWSHLVEHLVIRSTIPENSSSANAETMGDHMRLDWYGHTNAWREGLTHHARWLTGSPFTAESLEAEKPKVLNETQFTEKNLATHKFALAAWNQGVRHGRSHAGVRAEITSAPLADVQVYRDNRLTVVSNTLVCLVGGIPPAEALAALENELGGLRSKASLAPPVPRLAPGDVQMTWDLGVRHLLLTWPLPESTSADYAALWLAAQLLNMRLSMDATMNSLTGPAYAGVDLITREQRCFYVTAALRANSDEVKVREKLLAHVQRLVTDKVPALQLQAMSSQAAEWIRGVPDLAEVQRQTTQVAPALLEMNLGLQWATQRYRHPTQHAQLAQHLSKLREADLKKAAGTYLAPGKVRTCWIRPVNPK